MPTIDEFNRLPSAAAGDMMARCCASARWGERMVAGRPYHSVDELSAAADRHWRALEEDDFLEAFCGHPKIGDPNSGGDVRADTRRMAAGEQSSVAEAPAQVVDALARGNEDYEKKFGFIFIVCASGKSAEEMLGLLRARAGNTRNEEIANAAEEQRKITQIRIHKLFDKIR